MIARMASVGHLSDEEWEAMNKRNKPLKWEDMEWLQHQCDTCTEVGAQANTVLDLKHEGQELFGTLVSGVTSNMAEIEDKTISEGRFILTHEVERAEMVCVLGDDLKEKFFPGEDPIGKTLKIRDLPMTVVGVEEKRGSMFGNSMDNNVYIPLTTWQRMFGRRQSLQVHGKAPNREQFQKATDEARVELADGADTVQVAQIIAVGIELLRGAQPTAQTADEVVLINPVRAPRDGVGAGRQINRRRDGEDGAQLTRQMRALVARKFQTHVAAERIAAEADVS